MGELTMDQNRDLVEGLELLENPNDRGLSYFIQRNQFVLCKHTIAPDDILGYLGFSKDIIAEVMHPPGLSAKNSNMYGYIQRCGKPQEFIEALVNTDNKIALETIRNALVKAGKISAQNLEARKIPGEFHRTGTQTGNESTGRSQAGDERERGQRPVDTADSMKSSSPLQPSSTSGFSEDGGRTSKKPEKPESYDCKNVRVLFINQKFDARGKSEKKEYTVKKRDGADADREYVENLFDKTLRMKLEVEENVESDEIPGILKKFKRKCLADENDGCIVLISTHGGKEPHSLLMDDLKPIHLERDVVQQFGLEKFPDFNGKPKIFLFNACRQERTNISELPLFTDEDAPESEVKYSDILLGHSTLPGHVSFRGKEVGSCYLKFLHDVYLENEGKKLEIRKLLHITGRKVAGMMESGNSVQIPEIRDRLFDKNFYL